MATTTPNNSQPNSLENIIKLAGLIISFCTLMITAVTYVKNQKWESAKFITQKLEAFSSDKDVQRAQMLLDYDEGMIYTDNDSFYYTQDLLTIALRVDSNLSFPHDQMMVRNILDNYFSKLSTFNTYYEMGLSDNKIITSFLKYYITVIGDTSNKMKTQDSRKIIWNYIDYYRYQDVQKLCEKYGYALGRNDAVTPMEAKTPNK